MKKKYKHLLLITLSILIISCKTTYKATNFKMIFDDTNNFWTMYDKVKLVEDEEKRVEIIKSDYLDKASYGLRLLIYKDRLKASKYSKQLKDTVFYNSIRQTTYKIQNDSSKIRKYTLKLEEFYPKAKFSNIYFVVGQFKHGGTVINGTTIIEIQKNAKTKDTKSTFLYSKKNMKYLIDYDYLASLIIHEQIHINQKKGLRTLFTNALLRKTISEGSADFIMFLVTNQMPIPEDTYVYGEEHEKELWLKFKKYLKEDYQEIKKEWFYNYNRIDLPPDLGYFIGFKICEKYYNECDDKTKAIEFILDGNNYTKIIEQSNYDGGK